ncbi:MAG: hypothetical protein V7L29_30750 [Nostoc sp.]
MSFELITPNSCTDAINEPARCGGSPRCSDWRRVSTPNFIP